MIPLRKLERLQDQVCVRKTALVLHQAASSLIKGNDIDYSYIYSLVALFHQDKFLSVLDGTQKEYLSRLEPKMLNQREKPLAYVLEDISSLLLCALHAEPADWDFTDNEGSLDKARRVVRNHILVLDRLRSPFNVGSIFRSADSFGVQRIILVEGTASSDHPRCIRTARGTVGTVEHQQMTEEEVVSFLQGKMVFALELGGLGMASFSFPPEGVAVIGSEELGVSPRILSLCDQSKGRVSIEMQGTKGSLNVSVAAGILLYNWD
ncbi:MAG: TrmH family RNA methyltransferase [Sphaerochaetaceae bacterium]